MTYIEFQNRFSTEKDIVTYYISMRYGKKEDISCRHCGSLKVYQRTATPRLFDCADCKNTFSIFKQSIFEHSSTDLRKWMYAFHLFLNGKKGISGLQLQREIGVTYKTAWRILKQIRLAMGNEKDFKQFETICEIDETYIGGKPHKENKHGKDDHNKRGRGTKKTPVVGIIERSTKRVHAKVALPNKEGKKLTGMQLLGIIDKICKDDTTIISDEFSPYNILDSRSSYHNHIVITHRESYANGAIHTNNIESFWATLKRGVYGIYHQVSVKYLQNYVNEFSFRYNYRNTNIFDTLMQRTVIT